MDLTDVQWAVLEPTFRPRRRPDGRDWPWTDPRAVMNGVPRSGASIGYCNASPRTSGTAARSI